jgi:RNA polymerase sigma factor (sigma-70 family)
MTRASTPAMNNSRDTAITTAVKHYGEQLLGYIRGRVPRLEDAEDILQDVWFQLSRLPTLDNLDSLSGWLYRVTKNRITDKYRQKQPELLDDLVYHDEDGELSLRDILLSDFDSEPDLQQWKELFWAQLRAALDTLPESQRLVFIAHEIDGRKLQAIADEQGENIKTIISRKRYAVKALRDKLTPIYQLLNN